MASIDEETPLLTSSNGDGNGNGHGHENGVHDETKEPRSFLSPPNRLLVTGLMVSTSFSFTQVPILFLFQRMVCEDYYDNHPPFEGDGNRCNIPPIDAEIAQQIALIGLTTTICGTVNLFVAGWFIKRLGPKLALLIHISLPAIRVLIQTSGATIGGRLGIIIFQVSQLIGIIGGPVGYTLVLNTSVSELVAAAERTGAFGKLQGATMVGTAIGFLVGSILGDVFDPIVPFKVAFCSFVISSLYAAFLTPYIDPQSMSGGASTVRGIGAFFAPLKILGPQKLRLNTGKLTKSWGITFLALGVFLGVLATGYAPVLIQMYAISAFQFRPAENGLLMAVNFLTRGVFLMVVFPSIISHGRKWFAKTEEGKRTAMQSQGEGIPTHPEDFDPSIAVLPDQEPAERPKPVEEESGQGFDLFFLRWSLVVDGAITSLAGLVTQGWQIYLVGGLLPLASGSAPAAKGVITEMCPPSKRSDAIQAMTLVENVATLATLAVFGSIFSMFTEMGRSYLTFYCNAAVAMIAVGVLVLSRFPPSDSTFDDLETDEQPSAPVSTE